MPIGRMCRVAWIPLTVLIGLSTVSWAEPADTLYDESLVPAYTLPDPLVAADGRQIDTAEAWQQQRRPELLRLFQEQVYGRCPEPPDGLTCEVTDLEPRALEGRATRKQISLFLKPDKSGPRLDLLIYLPNDAERPVPAFLGLNFGGNQSIHADPEIRLSTKLDAGETREWDRGSPRNRSFARHRCLAMGRRRDPPAWLCLGHDLLWGHRPGL